MQLTVLEPPARGEGCVDRGVETVDLGGELGQVKLIVSGCQQRKFDAGIQAKVAELRAQRLPRDEMQRLLQSWIDGGSPCDMPYADPGDQVPFWQAMAAEAEHYGGRSGAGPPGMPPPMILFEMLGLGPEYQAQLRARRRRLKFFLVVYTILMLAMLCMPLIRLALVTWWK